MIAFTKAKKLRHNIVKRSDAVWNYIQKGGVRFKAKKQIKKELE